MQFLKNTGKIMNGLQISLMQCCLTGGKLFKGMTEDEYLSHMRKEDKFLSVVTVVIYYGESMGRCKRFTWGTEYSR